MACAQAITRRAAPEDYGIAQEGRGLAQGCKGHRPPMRWRLVRPTVTRHIGVAMNSTITKPPKRMRLAGGAVLIPHSSYEAWHTRASAVPGGVWSHFVRFRSSSRGSG